MEPKIFNLPRPKKSVLPPQSKKRKIEHKIEEISFDTDARADYLTGFHKRKLQRAKQAQVEAEKKAREEKIQMRKQLKNERQQELDAHVQAVNRLLKDVAGSDNDEEAGDQEEAWEGIPDEKPIVEPVNHEEEYVDEDLYTTVTVEEMDVSKEGLLKVEDGEDSDDTSEAPKLVQSEAKPKKVWPKKEKRKKFTYESKAERKFTRNKQSAGNKAKADARRGNG
ncbi:Uncharacterized protein BP5553_01341 [Venustampulla echinocandica]|uniref:Ribosomal RNA-processing protein 17 n=1 Tax=Venustampulla echinocandica TaxID=2656787 RepID=A0A370U0R5_9HELO|nr:Uncharacterized protein BP5553_01341 [Venustampulla echinocandica]RDL41362.1 Uncharacterized protein BP5553_01341 [Venustampulla echinocandica]